MKNFSPSCLVHMLGKKNNKVMRKGGLISVINFSNIYEFGKDRKGVGKKKNRCFSLKWIHFF